MHYLTHAEESVGYRVKVWRREAFTVTGLTMIVPPDAGDNNPGRFWEDVRADGRLAQLQAASALPTWVLGLGSWDPACKKGGYRYAICIEETEHTDFSTLRTTFPLFTKEIGASDWLCFETTGDALGERIWKDDPYKMLKQLGYQFHTGDFSVGLHFDAYPPDFDAAARPAVEFWITVKEA